MKRLALRSCIPLGLAGLLLLVAGCGPGDDIGSTLPVSGKVTVDNKPLPSGMVTFSPDESKGNKGKFAASGKVSNGEYALESTSAAGLKKTGAPPGWYKVMVAAGMPPGMDVSAPPKGGTAPKTNTGESMPVAARFSNAAKTPLSVEVKEGAPAGHYDLKVSAN